MPKPKTDGERHMLSTTLPPGAHAQFKIVATQQGKSMAAVIRNLVLGYNRRHWRGLVAAANATTRAERAKEANHETD